jgi:hypothetical protein
LIHGEFKPVLRWGYVPMIVFQGEHETIIALYDDIPVSFEDTHDTIWILNASTKSIINVQSSEIEGSYSLTTRNKFGTKLREETIQFPLSQLTTEVGGSITLRKA